MHESFDNQRFECVCGSFQHCFRMVMDAEDGSVWIDVPLNNYLPWYKRAWVALKYILIPGRSRFGDYDSIELQSKDYERIVDILGRSKRIIDPQSIRIVE